MYTTHVIATDPHQTTDVLAHQTIAVDVSCGLVSDRSGSRLHSGFNKTAAIQAAHQLLSLQSRGGARPDWSRLSGRNIERIVPLLAAMRQRQHKALDASRFDRLRRQRRLEGKATKWVG